MKRKLYQVYKPRSTHHGYIRSTCITRATKKFIKTLDRPVTYRIENLHHSTIRYMDNQTTLSDFVVSELI